MPCIKKYIFVVCVLLGVVSCNCNPPPEIKSIQASDKSLTCKDIIMEINEAEFYRQEGRKAQGIEFQEALVPMCWLGGYLEGRSAIDAADGRINYLSHIYDLLECGGRSYNASSSLQQNNAPAAMTPMPVPVPGGIPGDNGVAPPYSALEEGALPTLPSAMPGDMDGENLPGVPSASSSSTQKGGKGGVLPAATMAKKPYDPNFHAHLRPDGNRYFHSHPFSGAHKHAPDGSVMPSSTPQASKKKTNYPPADNDAGQ